MYKQAYKFLGLLVLLSQQHLGKQRADLRTYKRIQSAHAARCLRQPCGLHDDGGTGVNTPATLSQASHLHFQPPKVFPAAPIGKTHHLNLNAQCMPLPSSLRNAYADIA